MKRHKLIIFIVVAAAILAAAGGFMTLSLSRFAEPAPYDIRSWIGIAEPPETVTLHFLRACQNGDIHELQKHLAKDTLQRFLHAAALDREMPLLPAESLQRFTDRMKFRLLNAEFETEADPLNRSDDRALVVILIRYPDDRPVQRMTMPLIRETNGSWKCCPVLTP